MLPYPVCPIDSCGRHYLLLSPFESDYSHIVRSALCLNNIRLMFHAPDYQSLVRSALCRSNIRFMFHTPDCPICMHFTLRRLVWSFMDDRGRATSFEIPVRVRLPTPCALCNGPETTFQVDFCMLFQESVLNYKGKMPR